MASRMAVAALFRAVLPEPLVVKLIGAVMADTPLTVSPVTLPPVPALRTLMRPDEALTLLAGAVTVIDAPACESSVT